MRFYNYNAEKKDNKPYEIYFKFGLFGLFLAAIMIGGLKLLSFLFKIMLKYWIWVIVLIAAAFLIKYFFFRKRVLK